MNISLCTRSVVSISKPPESKTVCRGSDVMIHCGYAWSGYLPVTWIINGTLFTEKQLVDSPSYQLNNPTTPMRVSLTIFSINGTTTFQCVVHSTPNTTSTLGTITVTNGMYVCTYNICSYVGMYTCKYAYVQVFDH